MARFITAPLLEQMQENIFRHAFFTRNGGVSKGIYASLNTGLGSRDDPEHVRKNRRRAMQALGASALATPSQKHTDICAIITSTEEWDFDAPPVADAIATTVPDLMVAVNTADCAPVLFADPVAKVVAAAHAGWRGAIGGVLENTIAAMEKLGATRSRITAVVGPCISQAAYEVGPEFRETFLRKDAGNDRFFHPAQKPGHFMFDLPGYNLARLQAAGIGQAGTLQRCTHGEEQDFFSYRRTCQRNEPDYGRQLSAIVLLP